MRLLALLPFLLFFSVDASAATLKEVFGFSVLPDAPVPPGYAEKLIPELFPYSEWEREGFPFARAQKGKSYLLDYGERGRLIVVDRWISLEPANRFALVIERPVSMRLRHKIVIGTDMADWEILKKSRRSGEGDPFERTYLLRDEPGGALRGIAFYEGAYASIQWNGRSDKAMKDALERLTWNLARRLRGAYASRIAPIANALDNGSPARTRPDLPDPDHTR